MTDMNKNDGLYFIWDGAGLVHVTKLQNGMVTADVSSDESMEILQWAQKHVVPCETMDDMPTVARPLADAICEQLGLHGELVAVCRVD
jgi:hypothetical protein